MSTAMCGEAICWSEVTSCRPGSFAISASMIGAQWFSAAESVEVSVYWYCVLLSRPSTLMSCPACMKSLAPAISATRGRSRWMIRCAEASRSPNGLSWMNMRAVFSDELPPVEPTKLTTPPTPGSFCTTAESSLARSAIAANEMSCRASAWPKMKPVSCSGGRPRNPGASFFAFRALHWLPTAPRLAILGSDWSACT